VIEERSIRRASRGFFVDTGGVSFLGEFVSSLTDRPL